MAIFSQLSRLNDQLNLVLQSAEPASEQKTQYILKIAKEAQEALAPHQAAYVAINATTENNLPKTPHLAELETAVEEKINSTREISPDAVKQHVKNELTRRAIAKAIANLKAYKTDMNKSFYSSEQYIQLQADIDSQIALLETKKNSLPGAPSDQPDNMATIDKHVSALGKDINALGNEQSRSCLIACSFFKARYKERADAYNAINTQLERIGEEGPAAEQELERTLNTQLKKLSEQKSPHQANKEQEKLASSLTAAISVIPDFDPTNAEHVPEIAANNLTQDQIPYGLKAVQSTIAKLKSALNDYSAAKAKLEDELTTPEQREKAENDFQAKLGAVVKAATECRDTINEHGCGAMSAVKPEIAAAMVQGLKATFSALPKEATESQNKLRLKDWVLGGILTAANPVVGIAAAVKHYIDNPSQPMPSISKNSNNPMSISYDPNFITKTQDMECTVKFKLGFGTDKQTQKEAEEVAKDFKAPYLASSSDPEKPCLHTALLKEFGDKWVAKNVRYNKDTGSATISWGKGEARKVISTMKKVNEAYLKYKKEKATTASIKNSDEPPANPATSASLTNPNPLSDVPRTGDDSGTGSVNGDPSEQESSIRHSYFNAK